MREMKLDWKTCIKVVVSIFALYLCIHYWDNAAGLLSALIGAASPLLLGCVMAYMINILMSMYERHFFQNSKSAVVQKCRRPVCMLAAMVTLVAVVALIISLVVPQLVSCIMLIIAQAPDAIKIGIAKLDEWGVFSQETVDFLNSVDWQSKLGQIVNMLTSGLGSVMDVLIGAVTSVFSWVVDVFMGLIFAIYLLMGKDKLARQFGRVMDRYLKPKANARIRYVLGVLNDCFRRYIVGQCTEAVILGLLCTLGMLLLRLPYATMIGALIAFTALIPVAGAYIGGVVGTFMILMVSPIKAVIFLIFLVVLQQLEGNLIYPRVVGSSMGLPGMWVLAAVTIGGGMMGILGMLLGVPLAAAVYRLLRDHLNGTNSLQPAAAKHEAAEPEQT